MLEFMINYGVGVFGLAMFYLQKGYTLYHVNKFDKSQFFDQLMKYRVHNHC